MSSNEAPPLETEGSDAESRPSATTPGKDLSSPQHQQYEPPPGGEFVIRAAETYDFPTFPRHVVRQMVHAMRAVVDDHRQRGEPVLFDSEVEIISLIDDEAEAATSSD